MGVTFLGEEAPEYFSEFGSAFVSMFRITIGSADWWFDVFPASEDAGTARAGPLVFFVSYVVRAARCRCCGDAVTAFRRQRRSFTLWQNVQLAAVSGKLLLFSWHVGSTALDQCAVRIYTVREYFRTCILSPRFTPRSFAQLIDGALGESKSFIIM